MNTLAPGAPSGPAPALSLLLGPQARDLVGAALDAYGDAGSRLRALRPTMVGVRPSGAALVRYAAEIERRDASRVDDVLVAATGSLVPDGAAVLAGEIGGERVEVGLWRWPHDPALPALRHVVEHDRPSERFRDLLSAAGARPDGPLAVRVRSYRPGRRAVLAITCGERRLFGKVVPPARIHGLRRRHDLLAPHVPVPPLCTTPDGLAIMPALPGTPARGALARGDRLPGAAALEALLDRLPPALTDLARDPGHLRRAGHFAAVLALTAITDPDGRARLAALTERLAERTAPAGQETHPLVAVHGDFHEGQLLLRDGAVSGLLDVDTAGAGHRIDDWATLIAHLSVLRAPAARRWSTAVLAHAESRFPRQDLRPRIAAAVLGLATGPFRVQQRDWDAHTRHRLALAQRWLDPVSGRS